jgi:hypothetical protein
VSRSSCCMGVRGQLHMCRCRTTRALRAEERMGVMWLQDGAEKQEKAAAAIMQLHLPGTPRVCQKTGLAGLSVWGHNKQTHDLHTLHEARGAYTLALPISVV